MSTEQDALEEAVLDEISSGHEPKKDVAAFVLDKLDSAPKPIMTVEVEEAAINALQQYMHKDKWTKWGLDSISEQGSSILLHGPPGTGKTVIARWMAKKVKRGFKQLNMAALMGDGSPGSIERALLDFFRDCRKRNSATIFADEVDQMLMSRDGDLESSWQISTIETLMVEISKYKGLFIAATNHPGNLDSAIDQRFMAIIHVGRPDHDCRLRLWKSKMPDRFPLKLTEGEIRKLATHDLNGRQIETVIMNCAREHIRLRTRPVLSTMTRFAIIESEKHINRDHN